MKRFLFVICALTACGSDGDPAGADAPPAPQYPPGFDPPAPPPGGVQFLGKPFEVAPGEEVFKCVYLDGVLPEDMDIGGLQTYQMNGGHHVIFSWVVDSYTPADPVHDCGDTEMVWHRFVGAGGADPNLTLDMPEGVALKVPGGKRLVIQAHYINSGDEPMTVMDAVNPLPMDGPVERYAAMAAQSDASFTLPPGEYTTRDLTCNVTEPTNVFRMVGHTHEWGRIFKFELEHADGSREMLYENLNILPDFRDNAEVRKWDPDAPLALVPGDKLHLRCEWMNDTPDPLYFPQEMCVSSFYYYPSRGFEVCDVDGGTFQAENPNGKPVRVRW
jgi:hypothetical protein